MSDIPTRWKYRPSLITHARYSGQGYSDLTEDVQRTYDG